MIIALYLKVSNIRAIKVNKAGRPATTLSQSSLFTGSSQEENMMMELEKEILCCDSTNILVPFCKIEWP